MNYKKLLLSSLSLILVNTTALAEIIVDTSDLNSAVNETVSEAIKNKNERLESRRQAYTQSYVLVSTDCISGFFETCFVKGIDISTSYPVYTNELSGGSSGLHSYNNNKADLAGTYGFNVTLDVGNNRTEYCSGSFTLNGSEDNVLINVHRSSCDYFVDGR